MITGMSVVIVEVIKSYLKYFIDWMAN